MSTNDDFLDLETCAREERQLAGATRFRVRIDDERYRIDDPKPTGRQLLALADKKPVEEHLIFLILRGGGFEEIRLDETIDLTRPGSERFIVFASSASYRLEIDGERKEWGTPLITGLKLKEIAGVDPTTYALWREVRGGDDIPVQNDQLVDLSEEGLERFFTVIEHTTAGDVQGESVLPRRDRAYLEQNFPDHLPLVCEGQTGVILKDFPLPVQLYDVEKVDILILLPAGYPDVPPDMFYCTPWVMQKAKGGYPKCADCAHPFNGISWQRWSRHNSHWRVGKDGIWTMIKRVDCALREIS